MCPSWRSLLPANEPEAIVTPPLYARFQYASLKASMLCPEAGNGMKQLVLTRGLQRPEGICRWGSPRAVVVAATSMFLAASAASADPYKWCAVDSNSGGTNCGFVTIEQCRASVSGQGGFCEPKQVVPPNLSPAAKAAAPKTDPSGSNGNSLMECVTNSCRINCSPTVAKRFRPKWCKYFKEPV